MPNNLQILAYVKAMQDRTMDNLAFAKEQWMRKNPSGYPTSASVFNHEAYLQDLIRLEKFIKGAE